jgi:hypothetical protein
MEKILFPSLQVDETVLLTEHKNMKKDLIESLERFHEDEIIRWSKRIDKELIGA